MPRSLQNTLPPTRSPRVVAFGGGHGLAASLRALRRVSDWLTAVVGVADDGGSSGRLRRDYAVPPPGDLRMALAALCGDDAWGRTWSRVVQHRFGGDGELAGHSVGNLLITALWEETGDVVAGLDLVASLLEAHGRVLPVSGSPLDFVAEVQFEGEAAPREVRGQAAVAGTPGRVVSVRVEPPDPPVCREAITAVEAADHLVLGPGSWYTSVTAPLLVPELREAVRTAPGARSLVLNLVPQPGETSDFKPHTHLQVWRRDFPDITLQHVFADPARVDDVDRLRCEAEAVGADLVLRPLTAAGEDSGIHDPDLLAAAFAAVFGRGRITPWR